MSAKVSKMKVSVLTNMLGKSISSSVYAGKVTCDPDITVVEYMDQVFAFQEDISNCVFLIRDTENDQTCTAYLNIENAIADYLQRKGWVGLQTPSVRVGIDINGKLYAYMSGDCWEIYPMKLSDSK